MAIQKLKTASKTSKRSAASASPQQQVLQAASVSPQPTPFFPYARYTSIVGVHTSLLAFTALILPRSAFADLSSPSAAALKPRRDAIVTMTENPARTVAWMCFGCCVLQLWWAGWVREWRLEASIPPLPKAGDGTQTETEAQKAERILRQKEWDSQKANANAHAVLAALAASAALHIVAVLFGAHFASHMLRTYLLSLMVALLTVYAPVYVLGIPSFKHDSESLVRRMTWVRLFAELSPRTPVERALVYPAVGTFLGCWTGVIPIGLDWDRPWQAWPLTPAWGAIGGYIIGSLWALVVTNTKQLINLGVNARREDSTTQKSTKNTKKRAS